MSRWISDIYIRARMKQNPLLQGNCEYELWKQFVDQLVDAMPSIEITRCRDCKWNSECRMLDDDNGYCSQADRKTENSSEKPNNCEKDCFLCKWLGDVDVCGRCRNRNLFAEADTEPTISKMEQVEDEPQLTPNYCGTCKHMEVSCGDLPCDVCHGYSNYEPKDEPQTDCDTCKHKGEYAYCRLCGMPGENNYEPQTERNS